MKWMLGARPLPTINTTYVTNALWAGTFGSFGVNAGTESVWHQDTLVEINFQELMGLEANNARALIVHRQVINKAVTDSLGYTALFDAAFPDIPVEERYTPQNRRFRHGRLFPHHPDQPGAFPAPALAQRRSLRP